MLAFIYSIAALNLFSWGMPVSYTIYFCTFFLVLHAPVLFAQEIYLKVVTYISLHSLTRALACMTLCFRLICCAMVSRVGAKDRLHLVQVFVEKPFVAAAKIAYH